MFLQYLLSSSLFLPKILIKYILLLSIILHISNVVDSFDWLSSKSWLSFLANTHIIINDFFCIQVQLLVQYLSFKRSGKFCESFLHCYLYCLGSFSKTLVLFFDLGCNKEPSNIVALIFVFSSLYIIDFIEKRNLLRLYF